MGELLEKIAKQHAVIQLRLMDYLTAVGAAFTSLVVYMICMTPGVPAGDGGELAVAVHYLGVGHAPGYPLHSLLGKLVSVLPMGGSIAWKTNVFSGICASIAIFFTTLIAIRILLGVGESFVRSRIFGAVGGLFLAFSSAFWSQSIFCEVYAVGIVFQVAILWVLLLWIDEVWTHRFDKKIHMGQGHLLAMSFLFGIAIAGHLSVLMMQLLIGGTVLGVLFGFVFPQKELTVAQWTHGRSCVYFLLLCLGALLCGLVATVVKSDMIGVGYHYGLGDVKKVLCAFFLPNLGLVAMYCGFYYIFPEKLDPKNYLQRGVFVVIQMFFLLYLGYFVNAYLYIRGNANPPINWGGIGESQDILEKISKFVCVILRKQYGDQGRVGVTLESVFFSMEWILWVLYQQVNWPLIAVMLVGGVTLLKSHMLYAYVVVGGFITFTLQMAIYLRIQDELWSQVSRVFFLFSLVPMSVMCCVGFAKIYGHCSQWRQQSMMVALFCSILFVDTPVWSGFFPKSWVENDRRQDKVCQDYAKDMLRQCPAGSILLTEGPDNEVFPLLYYRYVEKVRLDMDIFDQKGNIFPRIYGNFFALNYPRLQEAVDLVRDLRDFQLCSTGKPIFWTFERDLHHINYQQLQDRYQALIKQYPILKDSVLGMWAKDFTQSGLKNLLAVMVPPTVFDGKLSTTENLHDMSLQELGPWFLRQEGILYRVWPAKFAALSVLECVDHLTKNQILRGIRNGLGLESQGEKQLNLHLDTLEKQGFVRKNSTGSYVLIKTPWVTKVDWQSNYAIFQNYQSVQKKIVQWDYLISEVFVEYAKEILLDFSRRKKIRSSVGGLATAMDAQEEEMFSFLSVYSTGVRGFYTFYENFWNNLKDERGLIEKDWIRRYQDLFQQFYPESALALGVPLLKYAGEQLRYADRRKKELHMDASEWQQEFVDWSMIYRKFQHSVSFSRKNRSKSEWIKNQLEYKSQIKEWEESVSMQNRPDLIEKIVVQTDLPFFRLAQAESWWRQGKVPLAIKNLSKWVDQKEYPQDPVYVLGALKLLMKYTATELDEITLDETSLKTLGYIFGGTCLGYFGTRNVGDFKRQEYLEEIAQIWAMFTRRFFIQDLRSEFIKSPKQVLKDISDMISMYKTVKPGQKDFGVKKRILRTLLALHRECDRLSVASGL